MNDLTRPNAIHKITPPYTSQIRHLAPAEARELWAYITALETVNGHHRDLIEAARVVMAELEEAQS